MQGIFWRVWGGVAACLLVMPGEGAEYSEPYRPQYHFTPVKNWMNDPNGMVFYEGEYHLFYQYNPFGNRWGHMSWGHAVSPDMVHWKHLPLALAEENGVMIFSGSAVVDWKNSSGFGEGGGAPLVAIYTGMRESDKLQFQCLAYSNDKGRSWTKYRGNPVININSRDFRDPKVQWHEPTQRWIMTVSLSAEHKVRFYGSSDLKHWNRLSEFGSAGATAGAWECPDLFELPVEGTGEKRWVLVVNTGSGSAAGGSGGQYFVGQFDGTRFLQDAERAWEGVAVPPKQRAASARAGSRPGLWVDYGKDYYAAVSWSDIPKADGRRLWLGWMSDLEYAQQIPTSPWRSAMSLPRQVGLRKTAEGFRLTQEPVSELKRLRDRHFVFKGGNTEEANGWLRKNRIRGDQLELLVEFEGANKGVQGLNLLEGGEEKTVFGVDRDEGRLFLDRTKSGRVDFDTRFAGVHEGPLRGRENAVRVHIFVDRCSVEVFANHGETVFTDLVFPSAGSRGVECFSRGSEGKIRSVEVWTLKSVWR